VTADPLDIDVKSAPFQAPPLLACIGVAIVAVVVFLAIFGAWLEPHSPSDLIGGAFDPPGATLLGTDVLGRDLFSRLVAGARLTLFVTGIATTLAFIAGALWGFAAAELRGWLDDTTESLVNILLCFPPLMMGLLVVSALSSSLPVLIGAIAFIQLPRIVRVARSVGLDITTMQYVEVARARGEGLFSIMTHEILPNSLRPLGVEYGLRLTYSTLFIAGLSFLGLGIQPPDADWGGLVRENLSGVQLGVYLPALLPGLAIGLFAVGLNLIVDWLGKEGARPIPEELR
jgi:peptide/nickel transport system permease protein